MIGDALVQICALLNAYVSMKSGWAPGESVEDRVVLLDGDKMDPVSFKLGAVTGLLINVEQEHSIRPGDPYKRVQSNGTSVQVQPEIRLNLYVLFVASFKQYEQGLNCLAHVIQYFQSHRVFDRQNTPTLSDSIEKLIVEMVTLPFSEQNEVWGALRTTYRPSVLYRLRMLMFADETAAVTAEIVDAPIGVHQR